MRAPRYPLHPPIVHFPLALLATSLAFDLVGLVRDEDLWWTIAFWNIAGGLAIGVVTAVAGLIDSARVPDQSSASSVLTRHMSCMLVALGCYGGALIVRGSTGSPAGTALLLTLALEGLGLVVLLLGGYLGGELVYRHGIGRIEPPGQSTREL
jgi:uncharacterized membrane protein